jgi:hypothetical protein
VEARLAEHDLLWRQRRATPEAVYETLLEVVLPAARPKEDFLDGNALDKALRSGSTESPSTTALGPKNAGSMLARWAVAAGRADHLRKRVSERLAQPPAKLPTSLLPTSIAEAQKVP